jgi:hypothetical protein
MALLPPARIDWVSIIPLQQNNPRGVGQWVGRHLEIHVPMTELRCENRHNPINSQIVGARLSVPDRRLPDNGQANRMAGISGADFSILQN